MHRVQWDPSPRIPASLANVLTWTGLVFLACMGVLLTALAQWSRVRHIDEAKNAGVSLARLANAEMERRVDLADLALIRMTALGRATRWSDPLQVAAARNELHDLAKRLPNIKDLWLVGIDGKILASGLTALPSDTSVTGYDDFQNDGPDGRRLALDHLLIGKLSPQLLFTLSRRVTGPNGELLGSALATFRAQALSQMLGGLAGTGPFDVTVYAADGHLLASHPFLGDAAMLSAELPAVLRRTTTTAPEGVMIESDDRRDAHLWAWLRSPDLAMVMVVSRPISQLMTAWRREILPTFLFGLASLAGMTMLGVVALRRASSEYRSQNHLRQAGEALEAMLDEKEALLAEIHHRVNNNMQVIVNLLQMEAVQLSDKSARERLDALGSRVALMGRVHERLYASDSFARMELATQIIEHCRELSNNHPGATVIVDAEQLSCGLDVALPLALIAHELVTNALLHAGTTAQVTVTLIRHDGTVELSVHDPGQGPAEDGRQGLGLMLVQVLAEQVGATTSYRCGDGYCVTINVPSTAFSPSTKTEAPKAPTP